MKETRDVKVRMKGVGDGLHVAFDPTLPADSIREELNRLFKQLRHLAINARVTFDIGENEGYEELLDELGDYLKAQFGVGNVVCPSKRRMVSEGITRQRDMQGAWQQHQSDMLMLTGRVRSGQKVTARKHILILGDVNPGAEIVAGGDIIVMGTLSGIAAAGQPDNENAIVLALDFRPTQIQIGGIMAAGLPPSGDKIAEFAYVEDNAIVVEEYLKANPFGRQPWPEVR